MYIARIRPILLVSLTMILFGLMAACNGDKSAKAEAATKDKEAKWLGSYKNTKENGTLVLQAEHKGTLDMSGTKGDITWEIAGDDKIIVHIPIPMEMFQTSDGLRDTEGTVWKKT
jgi:hypothetical protein